MFVKTTDSIAKLQSDLDQFLNDYYSSSDILALSKQPIETESERESQPEVKTEPKIEPLDQGIEIPLENTSLQTDSFEDALNFVQF